MVIFIIILVIVLALIPLMVAGILTANKKSYKRILEIQHILRDNKDLQDYERMALKLEAYGLQAKINTTDKQTGAMAQLLLNSIDKM